ncbi:MAG: DUF3419 family protein [Pseudomonadota bacterium]
MLTKSESLLDAQIASKAAFDEIRYAQLWEDADVLVEALEAKPGSTLVSICSAGDNALAMLLSDPAKVIAIDLSRAQLACLELRIAAIRVLDHDAFLELMGSRPSDRRGDLFDAAVSALQNEEARAFWVPLKPHIVASGLGGVGKFENYFAMLRKWVLPITHSRRTRDDIFVPRAKADRARFLSKRWDNWRWQLMMKVFFSRPMMARFGRDPAFFEHVDGSVSAHVARRIRHAAVDLDPSANPYLHWIIKGRHCSALPLAWRADSYPIIRNRLTRLELRHGALETLVSSGTKVDGFNLSDIFEYMDRDVFETVYGQILASANPGARLVYWNMMAPRRVPDAYRERVNTCEDVEARCKASDKAFFYSDFVVEEVTDR